VLSALHKAGTGQGQAKIDPEGDCDKVDPTLKRYFGEGKRTTLLRSETRFLTM